jgi:short-subunit dehydrogenase
MSKFAIRALADGLYWEMKPQGVAVTLISPGLIGSEIRQQDQSGVFKPEMNDPAPQRLAIPTDKAVRQMLRAIEKRKKEAVITAHGKVIVLASKIAPGLLKPLVGAGRSVSRPTA